MALEKRKKKFFDVEMPLVGKQTQMQAYEIPELDGRLMKYDLTRILRGKSILMQFKVSIKDEKPIAIPTGIVLMPYFLRRIIRKGTDYVEDSFSVECKDAKLKIKPFLITRRKVSKAVRRALREKVKEEIEKYAKDKTTERIFEDILKNKIQKELSVILKKIYPLSLCEIKSLEIEKFIEIKETPAEKKANKKETEEELEKE